MADEPAECGEREPRSGVLCQREPGHGGYHIHIRPNDTVAWGLDVTQYRPKPGGEQ